MASSSLEALASDFARTYPEEAARLLARLSPSEVSAFLEKSPPNVGAGVAKLLTAQELAACLVLMDEAPLALLLTEMPRNQVACALRRLNESERSAMLARLPDGNRRTFRTLLRYPEDSAGALMEPLILTLSVSLDVGGALEHVRRNSDQLRYFVYVVDSEERLVGVVGLRELMTADPATTIAKLMNNEVERLSARADREAIMRHRGWERFHALPVVDGSNTLIGVLRYETLQQLVRGESRRVARGTTRVALMELFWEGSQKVLGEFVDLAAGGRGV